MPLRADNPALLPFRIVMDLQASNLVVIVAPAANTGSSVDIIAAHLAITHAEAAVCALLFEGRTVDEIAERRRVSPHTVRNQIKSVLGKAGLRRQTDLIRRLAQVIPAGTAES